MNKQQTRSSKGKARNPKGLYVGRNGNWYWRIKQSGIPDQIGDSGLPATESNAQAASAIRLVQIQKLLGEPPITQIEVSFAQAVPMFLEWYEGEHQAHPNTGKRAKTSMVSLLQFFGHRAVRSITPGMIEQYKTWRRKNFIKDITIRHDLHNLSKLLTYGMMQQWCGKNSVRDVSIPSDVDAVRMNVLTPAMEQAYFAEAKKRSQDLYDLGRIMMQQGPRPEEVMKLRKSDVSDGYMRVFGKSRASKRRLRMTAETTSILLPRLQVLGEWVFPSPVKTGEHIKSLQRAHDDVCEATGVVCTVYDFRHTFATRKACDERVPNSTLAAILGHSSLACIMKYVHPDQEHMDEVFDDHSVINGQEWSHFAQPQPSHSPSHFGPTLVTLSPPKKAHLGLVRANVKVRRA